MAMQLLLQVLQELEEEEFMKFKFFLKDPALKPQIPQGDLDDASRQNIAKFMVQHYTNRALVMARKMLEQIPHLELHSPEPKDMQEKPWSACGGKEPEQRTLQVQIAAEAKDTNYNFVIKKPSANLLRHPSK
ncbi:hypothetical protein Y1Q_0022921 [Alligator mississippiensis]|uniref:Pyrin domain-containing protein n=1 Tax=Alligator mississippiensis TaxID=8496 RepID=A0A151MHW8_ALLMI|nr:hypothetical protein Y1Q_0022921 [Alligator mississippiensis]